MTEIYAEMYIKKEGDRPNKRQMLKATQALNRYARRNLLFTYLRQRELIYYVPWRDQVRFAIIRTYAE